MNVLTDIIQWLLNISQTAISFLVGTILGGVFTWKVVVPKAMKNAEVEDLRQSLKKLEKSVDKLQVFFQSPEAKELLRLFQEGVSLFKKSVPLLNKVLENQENHETHDNHDNH